MEEKEKRTSKEEGSGYGLTGSVTNHTRQVGDHILYSKSDLLISASHQISDTTARTCCSYYTTA